ncbi:inner membrane complex protein 1f, putative [Plasmodium gaboni]|uniref:Inner membrane complex protein 1f, putative n=1 Tax=Plasmodium gaboni TaxID=647221 RepID=A0ABY1UVZ4_9APIC|nr:inner membrane complex protein 1f, putative [Plasmodium gaboni]
MLKNTTKCDNIIKREQHRVLLQKKLSKDSVTSTKFCDSSEEREASSNTSSNVSFKILEESNITKNLNEHNSYSFECDKEENLSTNYKKLNKKNSNKINKSNSLNKTNEEIIQDKTSAQNKKIHHEILEEQEKDNCIKLNKDKEGLYFDNRTNSINNNIQKDNSDTLGTEPYSTHKSNLNETLNVSGDISNYLPAKVSSNHIIKKEDSNIYYNSNENSTYYYPNNNSKNYINTFHNNYNTPSVIDSLSYCGTNFQSGNINASYNDKYLNAYSNNNMINSSIHNSINNSFNNSYNNSINNSISHFKTLYPNSNNNNNNWNYSMTNSFNSYPNNNLNYNLNNQFINAYPINNLNYNSSSHFNMYPNNNILINDTLNNTNSYINNMKYSGNNIMSAQNNISNETEFIGSYHNSSAPIISNEQNNISSVGNSSPYVNDNTYSNISGKNMYSSVINYENITDDNKMIKMDNNVVPSINTFYSSNNIGESTNGNIVVRKNYVDNKYDNNRNEEHSIENEEIYKSKTVTENETIKNDNVSVSVSEKVSSHTDYSRAKHSSHVVDKRIVHEGFDTIKIPKYREVEIVEKIVEVPVVHKVNKYVNKYEIKEVEKVVKKPINKYVETKIEVPELHYQDKIVEVPELQEVVKIIEKPEIKERIIYKNKIETKIIPKYIEVPVVKIVNRYEEYDDIGEVVKAVPVKKIVEIPNEVIKKVKVPVKKIIERPNYVPVIKYRDIPIEKIRYVPKIETVELVKKIPKIIDVPVPVKVPKIKVIDKPFYINKYVDKPVVVPVSKTIKPIYKYEGKKIIEIPIHKPYLITHDTVVNKSVENNMNSGRYSIYTKKLDLNSFDPIKRNELFNFVNRDNINFQRSMSVDDFVNNNGYVDGKEKYSNKLNENSVFNNYNGVGNKDNMDNMNRIKFTQSLNNNNNVGTKKYSNMDVSSQEYGYMNDGKENIYNKYNNVNNLNIKGIEDVSFHTKKSIFNNLNNDHNNNNYEEKRKSSCVTSIHNNTPNVLPYRYNSMYPLNGNSMGGFNSLNDIQNKKYSNSTIVDSEKAMNSTYGNFLLPNGVYNNALYMENMNKNNMVYENNKKDINTINYNNNNNSNNIYYSTNNKSPNNIQKLNMSNSMMRTNNFRNHASIYRNSYMENKPDDMYLNSYTTKANIINSNNNNNNNNNSNYVANSSINNAFPYKQYYDSNKNGNNQHRLNVPSNMVHNINNSRTRSPSTCSADGISAYVVEYVGDENKIYSNGNTPFSSNGLLNNLGETMEGSNYSFKGVPVNQK